VRLGALRALGTAALALGGATGGVGAVIEIAVAARLDRPPSEVLAAAATVAALGVLVGALMAVPAVAGAALARCWHVGRPARVAIALAGGVGVAWWLTDPLGRRLAPLYLVFCAGTGAALALSAWLARARVSLPELLAAAIVGLVGVAVVVAITPETYEELQDLGFLVAVAGTLAAAAPLAVRLLRWRLSWIAAAGAIAAALAVLAALGRVDPRSRDGSLRSSPGARALRVITDVDRDGYSALLGGGDCDDLDPAVHPGALDAPGGADANCDGVDAPAQLDDAARGLAPAAGDPALPPGAVDLVLLITIDCWRADALDPRLMPAVWAFAAGGMRFERMYAAGSSTLASLPMVVGVGPRGPWVGDIARGRGIAADAVFAGGVPAELWGFPALRHPPSLAERTTDAALARIAESSSRPRFLWVHYFDLHALEQYDGERPAGTEPAQLSPRYRVAAAHVDRAIGRLVAGLDRRGLLARTAVVITGDHGEGMGEHGVRQHGRSGFDPVLRVPGVLRAPGVPAVVVSSLVSHRDIPATLLGALGLSGEAVAAERFGRSWLRLRDDPRRPLHRFVISRSARSVSGRELRAPLAVLVDSRYKVMGGLVGGQLELYDMVADPGETRDLAGRERERARAMWLELAAAWDLDYQEAPE